MRLSTFCGLHRDTEHNRLRPFCLLYDKDKPCGAKQRLVSVACTIPGCKGRHIQKLHDFLKDVFREENWVHVVHGDDGWEESDEAWELGEGEMMIVGTVQQEDECSWQEACNAWEAQDEEATVGVYQVRVNQEISEPVAKGQCKKASTEKGNEQSLEVEDLLVEGEEQEYFLELLMRRASPERSKEGPPAKSEACSVRDRRRKNKGKKARKRTWRRGQLARWRRRKKRWTRPVGRRNRWPPTSPTTLRPRAEDWPRRVSRRRFLRTSQRPRKGSVPDRRVRNIPEVVLVRRWVSWGSGNFEG
jgi:hypothetical protein